MYNELRQYAKAVADYTEVLRLVPNLAAASLSRGLAHRELGDYKKAIADLESYMSVLAPDEERRRIAVQRLIDEMRKEG
jgi:regulator of sirC expression with transglutaminase-like and TPR domain